MSRDTVAYSVKTLPATASYTSFTVNINDLMPGVTPDSIIIMFNSSKYYMWNDSTWELPTLYIDRINIPETPMSIIENANSLLSSTVFPNPFTGSATLVIDTNFEQLESAIVSIFDMSGKKVIEIGNLTSNKVIIEEGTLSKGNYIYQVNSFNSILSKGKFIIQ